MEIDINAADGVERSEALDEHIHNKLGKLDKRFGDRITRVEVYLKDVNGQKGGVDKSCTMEARPAGMDPVAVEATDTDAYRAVRDATGKLDKAVEHRINRKFD